ncbi:hypothetical protein LTR37_020305 [Vermiconidia calcicola]|uniref:Uncharacterized protein n=1 Tax=Vermiconidia calcicola TaxID=1690605 RepID=A0ACC3MD35_9PEZI|nr:hypothetical protein LTR37_020305 [Vermiconidia calcicola]
MLAGSGKLSTSVKNYADYNHVNRAGQGVSVYVLDSGIRTTHRAFQGSARPFGGQASDDKSSYCQDTMGDRKGLALSIIGARTFGVAPRANLINVKITNNSGHGGSFASLGQAIEDAITEHNANKAEGPDFNKDPFHFRGSLINLSLGWEGDGYATKAFSSDTETLFINTGLHSKKKRDNEPFKWAVEISCGTASV